MSASISRLARLVRNRFIVAGEERYYVRALYEFDRRVGGDVSNVVMVLAQDEAEMLSYRLALCWLDGKGWGEMGHRGLVEEVRQTLTS